MYKITVKIKDKEDQVVEFEDKDKVKEGVQKLNGMRSMAAEDYEFIIEDEDGNSYEPEFFDLPRKRRFKNSLSNAIDKVIVSEGSRESFEWLLEHMAMKRYDTWDISDSLDEVFGEVETVINNDDIAEYDLSDEKVVQAKENNKVSKEEFLEALKAGA